MKWWSHVACGTLATLALVPEGLLQPYLVVLGSVLPDVFERALGAKHRAMHDIAFTLVLAPLFFTPYSALFVGAVDHILVDAMTLHGVTFFGFRVRGFLNTDNPFHNVVPIILHFALLALFLPA